MDDTVYIQVNGVIVPVTRDIPANVTLNEFLRQHVHLTGVKATCRQGACGACVVLATGFDPVLKRRRTRTVNSCLLPVRCCIGLEITTVEKLSDSVVPKRLNALNGSQCGFCTSGMVASICNAISNKGKSLKTSDVEQALDGNLCRCTGYRAIRDTCSSFACDAPCHLASLGPVEIEDLFSAASKMPVKSEPISVTLADKVWKRPSSLQEVLTVLHLYKMQKRSYRIIAGNTGTGLFPSIEEQSVETFVDIGGIPELQTSSFSPRLTIGAGLTLAQVQDLLTDKAVANYAEYNYVTEIAHFLSRVANTPVRNAATIGGNLMLRHDFPNFASDVFVALEAVGAEVVVVSASEKFTYTLPEFLKIDMSGKLLLQINLMPISGPYTYKAYKVAHRKCNSRAFVSAAFLLQFQSEFVVKSARLVYGGLGPEMMHASATEVALRGKNINNSSSVQTALKSLQTTLSKHVSDQATHPQLIRPGYKMHLVQALFYKCVLSTLGENAAPSVRSGSQPLNRPVFNSQQTYDFDKDQFPVSEPIAKLEGKYQCKGEARYILDEPLKPKELHAVFVPAACSGAQIHSIDPSKALENPEVVAFLSAEDIPGANALIAKGQSFDAVQDESLFCSSGLVQYAGQPVGIVVAKTRRAAMTAASQVQVQYDYEVRNKPITTIESAEVENKLIPADMRGLGEIIDGDMKASKATSTVHIEGAVGMAGQYQFPMETHCCRCVPTEGEVHVYTATQTMDAAQIAIARVLGIPSSKVHIEVRRLGGSFGIKLMRSVPVAVATALAAHVLQRPVRMETDIPTCMTLGGVREESLIKYKAGCDDQGILQYVDASIYHDKGFTLNETGILFTLLCFISVYKAKAWHLKPFFAITEKSPTGFMRGPGAIIPIAAMEYIFEQFSQLLGIDSVEMRSRNLRPSGESPLAFLVPPLEGENALVEMMKDIVTSSDFYVRKRQVEEFNSLNRWKKRGLGMTLMNYYMHMFDWRYSALVSIYHYDGTVAVTTAGIEMGQGLQTKVIQIVAKELGIPVEFINVAPPRSITAANSTFSAASTTTELNCYAAVQCCRELLSRLQPVKEELLSKGEIGKNNDKVSDWKVLVEEAHRQNIGMIASYVYTAAEKKKGYDVWGTAITEVELDVLTGEVQVLRSDISEDAGQSINPHLDVGQVEGAFVQGLGHMLTEKLVYDPYTGRLLTRDAATYFIPSIADIPADFRVSLRQKAPNLVGVTRAKATGEPGICLSVSALIALRQAVASARKDAGDGNWFQLDAPATPDVLPELALVSADQMVL